jgi:nucleotide-binding universal stress UspA family protein
MTTTTTGSSGTFAGVEARPPVSNVEAPGGLQRDPTKSSSSVILVGIDGSGNAASALRWALGEARVRQNSIEAMYVWQVPTLAYSAPGYIPLGELGLEDLGRTALDGVLAEPVAHDVKVGLRTVEGSPANLLIRGAEDPGIGLVALGSRGHSEIAGLLLGSVSQTLLHRCPKPLVIVPDGWPATGTEVDTRRIVVGVDGSRDSERAFAWAATEASIRKVALEVVTVDAEAAPTPTDDADSHRAGSEGVFEGLDAALEAIHDPDLEVTRVVLQGEPARTLVARASSAQMLVVGVHGSGPIHDLISGSVSRGCAHAATVPLVLVPSPHS